MQLGAFERMVELRHVVKQEARLSAVRLDDQCLVFKLVEIGLDVLVAGLWFQVDAGNRARHRELAALAFLQSHQPLHILRFGGLNAVAGSGLEENARVAQRSEEHTSELQSPMYLV